MQRKVLQDYINGFCRCVAERGDYYDVLPYAVNGSGKYTLDVLTGMTTFNEKSVPPLHVGKNFKEWLEFRCAQNTIRLEDILEVRLAFEVGVTDVVLTKYRRNSGEINQSSASLTVECDGRITTSEKVYRCYRSGLFTSGLESGSATHDLFLPHASARSEIRVVTVDRVAP